MQPYPLTDGRHNNRTAVIAAVAAVLATCVVFSAFGESIVDGLVERTPLREHKFAVKCVVAGGATYAIVVAGREVVTRLV